MWSIRQKIAFIALVCVLIILVLRFADITLATNDFARWESDNVVMISFDRDFNSNKAAVFKRNIQLYEWDGIIYVGEFPYNTDHVIIRIGCPFTDHLYVPNEGDQYRFYEYRDDLQVKQSDWLSVGKKPGIPGYGNCDGKKNNYYFPFVAVP